jgi:hypothetical protein
MARGAALRGSTTGGITMISAKEMQSLDKAIEQIKSPDTAFAATIDFDGTVHVFKSDQGRVEELEGPKLGVSAKGILSLTSGSVLAYEGSTCVVVNIGGMYYRICR